MYITSRSVNDNITLLRQIFLSVFSGTPIGNTTTVTKFHNVTVSLCIR